MNALHRKNLFGFVLIIVFNLFAVSAFADPCNPEDPDYDQCVCDGGDPCDCGSGDPCDCGWGDPCECGEGDPCDCGTADPCDCGWGDDCECGWADPCDDTCPTSYDPCDENCADFDPCNPDCPGYDPCINPDCPDYDECYCFGGPIECNPLCEDYNPYCNPKCSGYDPCNPEADCYDPCACGDADPCDCGTGDPCDCDWGDPCECGWGDPCECGTAEPCECNVNCDQGCPGNFSQTPGDWDTVIDVNDLLYLLSYYNQAGADINGDGMTSVDDLLILIANWGPCPGVCADGFNCGDDADLFTCGSLDCYCMELADGTFACMFAGGNCSQYAPCPDGTCPEGFVCVINTCCNGPVCVPYCD